MIELRQNIRVKNSINIRRTNMTKYLSKYLRVINLDNDTNTTDATSIISSLDCGTVEAIVSETELDNVFVVYRLPKGATLSAQQLNDEVALRGLDTFMFVEYDDTDINKAVFIQLLLTISMDKFVGYNSKDEFGRDKLIKKLETSDFFYAPATTRAHCNFSGGLCLHSLNVYFNMIQQIKNKNEFAPSSYDSIKICGLLHDISRVNYYEKSSRNVKVYSDAGSKQDELGKFDWEAQVTYKVKDSSERFIYGSLEQTSLYIIKKFLNLTMYEEIAILHALGQENQERDNSDNTALIFSKYPLATLLHIADLQASYLDEFDFDGEEINE